MGAIKDEMYDIVAMVMNRLSKDRPVHLLGIGGIEDILNGVACGIDTFDCVHPTRLARHGGALVKRSLKRAEGDNTTTDHFNLTNSRFKTDDRPIDPECECNTCKNFSRGYLHHLLKAKEILGLQALTVHNVHFMNKFMESIRNSIQNNSFDQEKKNWI